MMTTQALRSSLIKDLEDLRSGAISNTQARSRAYLAKAIIDTVKIEIAAEQFGVSKTQPLLLQDETFPLSIAAE